MFWALSTCSNSQKKITVEYFRHPQAKSMATHHNTLTQNLIGDT